MQITRTLNIVELWWIVIATLGFGYGLLLRRDARLDIAARKVAEQLTGVQPNGGIADIAHLLVVSSTLASVALAMFLAAGLVAATVPSPAVTSPFSYFIQAMLVVAESTISGMLWYQQRVRRRVLQRDAQSEALRKEADRLLAHDLTERSITSREELRASTDALVQATEAATDALYNGPMKAQINLTASVDRNTAAQTVANVAEASGTLTRAASDAANTLATEEQTDAVERNTASTDRNTDVRGST